MSYALANVVILFLISIPVLTMRILADERRQKTDQLILTAPVTVGRIVLGKFLALSTVFLIPVIIVCGYPLLLSVFGTVPMGEAYLAILGFFLYGLACISIGMFVSSLTESQVIAAVLTFAVLFLGYVMSGICGLISQTGNLLTKLLGCFDMLARFDAMLNGTLQAEAVVYFLSVTGLFLVLTAQSIQKRRFSVSKKTLGFGVYSSGIVVLSVALAVLANLAAGQLPGKLKSIDLTSEKLYSLTDRTEEFLKGLEEEVTIYCIAGENSKDTLLAQTLERFAEQSDRIQVRYVDPLVNPKFYAEYTETPVSANSLIVVSGKRSKVVDYNEIYESQLDYSTYTSTVTGYDGEGQITSALSYVTGDDMPKVYLITGHGELGFETAFTSAIAKENVTYETISLLNYDKVPEDAQCIIINAPTSDFSREDAEKVLDYLENGGNAVVIAAWTAEEMPYFESILHAYGLELAEGVVMEKDMGFYYQNLLYLLPQVEYDSLTQGIAGDYRIFVPVARGIQVKEEPEEGITVSPFLTTSEQAFSKINAQESTSYEKEETDLDGPFDIGVKAVKTGESGDSQLVLYSSEGIFTEWANQAVAGANLKLFSNTLGSMVEHVSSVSVAVKSYTVSFLTLPQSSVVWIAVVTVLLIPLAFLAAGIVIWAKRRRR